MSGTYKVNGDRLTGLTVYSTLPVGTVIASFTNSEVGFLPCDHSEYNQSDFPQLWAKLQNIEQCQSENEGKFYVPDLRESGLVGVGTSDNEDIVTHDSYVVGEFKDDQLQGHRHYDLASNMMNEATSEAFRQNIYKVGGSTNTYLDDGTNGTPRVGSTTHGKQTGIYYLIKAVDYASLPQNAIDDTCVTNANTYSAEKIESKFEYSTEEKVIGEYFGKPLYRKGYIFSTLSTSQTFNTDFTGSVESIVNWGGGCGSTTGIKVALNRLNAELKYEADKFVYTISSDLTLINAKLWVEYTKTTD